ncbi:WD40/YVTN/BNR-like repeat-containing protein [Limnobacter litoralis]|uniref:Photosynthesis system II assembly factor Ycf48/Hcf136-like domain-containing protein n=1 Tax=Limnobacter litoralis TaxID=481366 RepID=A0ABQ5YNQ4_9BURK|nr:YCF48-related protein [Limnobacter litoralis]GLR25072.1 hypothetical protein GCM10007875_01590 [Limnobacter litoralis]
MLTQPQQAFALKDGIERPAFMAPLATQAFMFAVADRKSTALAVGEHGIILRTQTGSWRQWKQMPCPVSVSLTNVRFVTDHLVFAVGHDGVVLKSTDAGQTWVKVFDGNQANAQIIEQAKKNLDTAAPGAAQKDAQYALEDAQADAQFGPSRPLLDVFFKNENTGWIVGSYGQIFETLDSGATWRLISQRLNNPELKHYNSIDGSANGLMLISGEGGLVYASSDWGQTWKTLSSGYNGHFYGTFVENPQPGHLRFLAYGFGGTIYRYDAEDAQWQKLPKVSGDSLVKALPGGIDKVIFLDQRGRMFELDEKTNAIRILRADTSETATDMTEIGHEYLISTRHGSQIWSLNPSSGQ